MKTRSGKGFKGLIAQLIRKCTSVFRMSERDWSWYFALRMLNMRVPNVSFLD